MRCEDELFRQYAKLLQNLSGVPMIEYGVGGKVLRHFNKMCFLRGLLACAGNAGLGIANDPMIQVDQTGADQRRERQDDRRGIAAGIGHQRGFFQLAAMQLRDAVHGLRHDFIGQAAGFSSLKS